MTRANKKPLLQAFWKFDREADILDAKALARMKSIKLKLDAMLDARSLKSLEASIQDRDGRISMMTSMSGNINLENLLESLLKETQPIERPTSMADESMDVEPVFSLDQAIDRYFVQYEREAIPTSEVFEHANITKLVNFLFEQEEELEEPIEDDDAGGDLDLGGDAGGDLGGDLGEEPPPAGEGSDAEAEPVINTPKINLQDFTRSVARLINNVHSLIDLQTIVLNRAQKYIQNNYNERTAKEMMEILGTTYDLKPVDNENHRVDAPDFPEPRAGVTGPVGG